MNILSIKAEVSQVLIEASKKGQVVCLPLADKNCRGEERQFSLSVLIEEVQPLNGNGEIFFRGKTNPSNGISPEYVDGITSIPEGPPPPHNPFKPVVCRSYGKLFMY
jgi:hypothetical protein